MKINDSYIPENIRPEEQTDKITVIVAVYNIKDFVRRCVDSILAQTYRNLEIILVDDGSTDESGRIVDEYARADERVKVIHKENGGLSSARNAGLVIATGEYLTYVDGDDWIDPDSYMRMIAAIREYGTEMAITRYRWVYQSGPVDLSKDRAVVMSGKELLDVYIAEDESMLIMNAAWNKLYKRELLGGLRFDENRWYEDILYTTQLFSKVGVAVYLDHATYNYVCDREGSYMNGVGKNPGIKKQILTDQIPIYRDRDAFLRGIGRDDLADTQNFFFLKRMMLYYTQEHRSSDEKCLKREILKELREDILKERPHYEGAFRSPAAKRQEEMKLKIFCFSPLLYLIAMRLNDSVIVPFKQRRRGGR